MTLQHFTQNVLAGEHLLFNDMLIAAELLFNEETPADDIAAFLVALSQKGETAHEVAALATVMKSYALQVDAPAGIYIDNCGTGGDGLDTFNISTTSAFVLAGGGISIAKHGNRKISSKSGSSDVLEALGIHTFATVEETLTLLEQEGITFLYAPSVHPKLKRLGEIRRAIGKPTIFNLVGPLTNPVPLKTQFVGINRPNFVMEYASVLQMLGRDRAVVVSGTRGMDEASLEGQNTFVLVDNGDLIPFALRAEDAGLPETPLEAIRGGDAQENAQILRDLLNGKQSPYFDTVLLNSGIGFFAYGHAASVKEGVEMARDSILSGRANDKLQAVIAFSEKIKKEGARS
ncbi:MAG: anthranilate phosphoribosyltransferase [Caryophanon sp.]|nr:anthranilate phosphoribosyltransferase [Caryophanon sp.]